MHPSDERQLTVALLAGDRSAAEALIGLTYRRVFGLLVNLSEHDRELAADLTQETYRQAWASLGKFEGRAAFSTWLYRIAWNVFLAQARRPRRLVPLEDEVAATARDAAEPHDETMVAVETGRRLRRAVRDLPEGLQSLVVARYWAGTPVRELARAEGVSHVAIHKRLRRALAHLGAALQEVTS